MEMQSWEHAWEHAWKYFELHSKQRMQAFHFFIILSAFSIGAFSSLLGENGPNISLIPMPISLIFLSFMFHKIDSRTKQLIKNSEYALEILENEKWKDDVESKLCLFNNDALATSSDSRARKWPIFSSHFSYSRAFNSIYLYTGLLGVFGSIICFI